MEVFYITVSNTYSLTNEHACTNYKGSSELFQTVLKSVS